MATQRKHLHQPAERKQKAAAVLVCGDAYQAKQAPRWRDFPNTFNMQEYALRQFDDFLDRSESGETVDTPRMYIIPNQPAMEDEDDEA
ncbi:hypothetical protein HRG_004729 [Hirsutella rhossiliensis]